MQRCVFRRRAAGVLLVAVVLIGTGGCGSPKTSDRDLLYITPTEADALVGSTGGVLGLRERTTIWVDPRSEGEYVKGHIPGAMHIPLEHASTQVQRLEGYDRVLVYGNTYNSVIARAMSKSLIEQGIKHVRTLRGGLRAWEDSGYPVEEGLPE